MPNTSFNKYRAAVEVLQRGRDSMVENLADDVLDQSDDLLDSGFLFNEFLETQGTRIHFLSLLLSQLEQSAEHFDEVIANQPPPCQADPAPPRKRKSRAKKLSQKASAEGSTEEA